MRKLLVFCVFSAMSLHVASSSAGLSKEVIESIAERIVWRGPRPGDDFNKLVERSVSCLDMYCLKPGSSGKRARQFTESYLKKHVLYLDDRPLESNPNAHVLYEAYLKRHNVTLTQEGEIKTLCKNLCCIAGPGCLFYGLGSWYLNDIQLCKMGSLFTAFFCLNPIFNISEIESQKIAGEFDEN